MNLRKSFFFFLFVVFLVTCTNNTSKSIESSDAIITASRTSCATDTDCTCGGIDTRTGDCFVGNKNYSARYVNTSQQCPDFCTGIAGHLETKCVQNSCINVPRPIEQIGCREDAKICFDGTTVARVSPSCEFANCPERVDIGSFAHWRCEDNTWKQNPQDCFNNTCIDTTDCQLLGVKNICGPTKIAAPKTVHRAPVFYADRCGSNNCTEILAKCPSFDTLKPIILNVDCQKSTCVTVVPEE